MTIKQKVRISNVLMVIIPILLTALVINICLHTALNSYWYTFQSMYNDENGIQFAQSIIYTYQQELWENNWEQSETMTDEINQSAKMTHMEHKLSNLGYSFMVTQNERLIYSNMTEEDMQVAHSVAGDGIDSAKTLTASRHEVSVIKNTFYYGEWAFSITAVHREQPETADGVVHYFENIIFRYILGFVILFVVLSFSVNAIMSWWISKSILCPLDILRKGTREIREGNLDKVLNYRKKDEFGAVCGDFENMRAYLKESVEQRLRDEKRRKDLLTGISHDLRTPLTSISGYVDGLWEGIADTKEKQNRYLQAIRLRTDSMVSLVDSLSEYCRLDSSRFRYRLEKMDMKDFLNQYLESCEYDAKQNNVIFELICEEKLYLVKIDKKELKRVFDNLFTNTIKYRNIDSSHVRILLNQNKHGTSVKVVFSDNGPGVPEESLGLLFDSFYRVDDARNKSEKGSGIGLAVAREIILGHGGSIWAENQEGLAIIMELPVFCESK